MNKNKVLLFAKGRACIMANKVSGNNLTYRFGYNYYFLHYTVGAWFHSNICTFLNVTAYNIDRLFDHVMLGSLVLYHDPNKLFTRCAS